MTTSTMYDITASNETTQLQKNPKTPISEGYYDYFTLQTPAQSPKLHLTFKLAKWQKSTVNQHFLFFKPTPKLVF